MKLPGVEHLPLSAQTAIFSAFDLQEFFVILDFYNSLLKY